MQAGVTLPGSVGWKGLGAVMVHACRGFGVSAVVRVPAECAVASGMLCGWELGWRALWFSHEKSLAGGMVEGFLGEHSTAGAALGVESIMHLSWSAQIGGVRAKGAQRLLGQQDGCRHTWGTPEMLCCAVFSEVTDGD